MASPPSILAIWRAGWLCQSESRRDTILTALRFLLQEARDQGAFSGAAYAVGTGGRVLEQGCVGTLAWEGGAPVTPESLWDMASVTKPVVALGIMVLLERGELSLYEPVDRFLPEYADTALADLSLYALLTHTAGISAHQPIYRYVHTREDLIEAMKRAPLRGEPGARVEYTSQGFMILGEIIHRISDHPLDQFLAEAVLAPMGMVDTQFNPPADLVPRIAATEMCAWRGRLIRGEVHDENAVMMGGVAGHAGLFSTLTDMVLLGQTMLRQGEGANGRLLAPVTVRLMTRNHTPHLNLPRGLGWQGKDEVGSPAGDLVSPRTYGHTGFTGTSIFIDPEADLFVVLLTNRVHPSRQNSVMPSLRPRFHNLVMARLSESAGLPG